MLYREATPDDAEQIALLHAESWRNTYRGMLSDEFLNTQVIENRRAAWHRRLTAPVAGQFVLVAEAENAIHGFICLFGEADEQWGVLLDNLHIHAGSQGRGLGTELMHLAAKWMQEHYPESGMHLWVFASNRAACRFYEYLGGTIDGAKVEDEFGDRPVRALRYVWQNVEPLIRSHV